MTEQPPGPYQDPPPLTAFAWRNGLVRPTQGRLLAGVCGALGRATNTDPVLWRVLLAVLSIFGGIGVLAYLLGWLLLPADGDTGSPVEAVLGRGRSATSSVLTVIGAVVVLMSLGVFVSEPFRPGPWGVVLVGGALLLLLRDRRRGREPGAVPTAPTPPMWSAPPTESSPSTSAPTAPGAPMPPAAPMPPGPPTAAAGPPPPFAPYGPFTPPPPPPRPPVAPRPPKPPRERSRLGLLTFSVMLMVVGVMVLIDLAGYSVPARAYITAALVTVGLGLVVGAWFGRARGLIALGIVLTLALGASSAATYRGPWHSGGTATWVPTTLAQVQSEYRHELGDAKLDLRNVDFSRATGATSVDVRIDLGSLEVVVPSTVDVIVDASVDVGSAKVFREEWSGLDPGSRTVTDYGTDGPGGGELRINASVDIGDLEVHR